MIPFAITHAKRRSPFVLSVPIAPLLSCWNIGKKVIPTTYEALVNSLTVPTGLLDERLGTLRRRGRDRLLFCVTAWLANLGTKYFSSLNL